MNKVINIIRNFFSKIFKKNDIKEITEPKKEKTNSRNKLHDNIVVNVNNEIINLQNDYEQGNISDMDLSKKQLEELIKKYENDISRLDEQLKRVI